MRLLPRVFLRASARAVRSAGALRRKERSCCSRCGLRKGDQARRCSRPPVPWCWPVARREVAGSPIWRVTSPPSSAWPVNRSSGCSTGSTPGWKRPPMRSTVCWWRSRRESDSSPQGVPSVPCGREPRPQRVPRSAVALRDAPGARRRRLRCREQIPRRAAMVEVADVAVVVVRGCYLTLRRAVRAPVLASTMGAVLVDEPGRSLTRREIADVLGIPVLARVPVRDAVSRAVDAGVLAARLPDVLGRAAMLVTARDRHHAGAGCGRMSAPASAHATQVDADSSLKRRVHRRLVAEGVDDTPTWIRVARSTRPAGP